MAAKKDKVHPAYIKVYFVGYDEPLAKKVELLARDHGLSASTVGKMAISLGLPMVQKQLDGLFPDQTSPTVNNADLEKEKIHGSQLPPNP